MGFSTFLSNSIIPNIHYNTGHITLLEKIEKQEFFWGGGKYRENGLKKKNCWQKNIPGNIVLCMKPHAQLDWE